MNDWLDYPASGSVRGNELYHHGILGQKWGVINESFTNAVEGPIKGLATLGGSGEMKNYYDKKISELESLIKNGDTKKAFQMGSSIISEINNYNNEHDMQLYIKTKYPNIKDKDIIEAATSGMWNTMQDVKKKITSLISPYNKAWTLIRDEYGDKKEWVGKPDGRKSSLRNKEFHPHENKALRKKMKHSGLYGVRLAHAADPNNWLESEVRDLENQLVKSGIQQINKIDNIKALDEYIKEFKEYPSFWTKKASQYATTDNRPEAMKARAYAKAWARIVPQLEQQAYAHRTWLAEKYTNRMATKTGPKLQVIPKTGNLKMPEIKGRQQGPMRYPTKNYLTDSKGNRHYYND